MVTRGSARGTASVAEGRGQEAVIRYSLSQGPAFSLFHIFFFFNKTRNWGRGWKKWRLKCFLNAEVNSTGQNQLIPQFPKFRYSHGLYSAEPFKIGKKSLSILSREASPDFMTSQDSKMVKVDATKLWMPRTEIFFTLVLNQAHHESSPDIMWKWAMQQYDFRSVIHWGLFCNSLSR